MAIKPHSERVGIVSGGGPHINPISPSKPLVIEKPSSIGSKQMLQKSRSNAVFIGPGSPVSLSSTPQLFASSKHQRS